MPTKKANTYLGLYRLNRAFDVIAEQLQGMKQEGLLNAKMFRTFEAFTGEIRAEINQHVLGILETIEAGDWARHGKVRNKIEKEIKR